MQRRVWDIWTTFVGVFDFVKLLHLYLKFSDFPADIDWRFDGFASIVPSSIDLVKFIKHLFIMPKIKKFDINSNIATYLSINQNDLFIFLRISSRAVSI